MNERDWEESPLVGVVEQVALHPVFVLRFFVEDDDEVALLEGQLVVIVSLAVVQRSAPTVAVSLENKLKLLNELFSGKITVLYRFSTTVN